MFKPCSAQLNQPPRQVKWVPSRLGIVSCPLANEDFDQDTLTAGSGKTFCTCPGSGDALPSYETHAEIFYPRLPAGFAWPHARWLIMLLHYVETSDVPGSRMALAYLEGFKTAWHLPTDPCQLCLPRFSFGRCKPSVQVTGDGYNRYR